MNIECDRISSVIKKAALFISVSILLVSGCSSHHKSLEEESFKANTYHVIPGCGTGSQVYRILTGAKGC
jgi:hypothetical protein